MGKLYFSLILLIAIIFVSSSNSFAAVTISESPDMKININGEVDTYIDVPIVVNGRSLLPLRAILTKLGVKNDAEHVVWDGSNNSVSIIKDEIKIILKVDEKIAYVNGARVELDVAPVNYKSRVYIPAAFIAQSLGKKVVWDAAMKMVLIRDVDEFNNVKGILEKAETAMNSILKYKSSKKAVLNIESKNQKMAYNINVNDQIDRKGKIWYGDTKKTEVSNEGKSTLTFLQLLLKSNATYLRIPPTEKWNKIAILTEEEFDSQFKGAVLEDNDINCAGLILKTGKVPDEILLSGKISLDGLTENYMRMIGLDGYTLTDAQVEISMDKNTFLINNLNLKISGCKIMPLDNMKFTAELNYVFSDYNGDFEIALPEGI